MTRRPRPGRSDGTDAAARRVRRTLWFLVVVAVVATGGVTRALEADPGPAAAVAVAISSLVAATATGLALRIWWALLRP